ncbi:hypothetical protein C4D60_Mb06t13500 [Musa balbisiana]|uniref:Uncharacterized protein n=1 Tax=Musa balbisiana TaxID=52838 RepID=A0A4S8IMR0_MUSBA|nr:hypothetical protein C4D60_Mb06t13500 [Musa balbisiana]
MIDGTTPGVATAARFSTTIGRLVARSFGDGRRRRPPRIGRKPATINCSVPGIAATFATAIDKGKIFRTIFCEYG